jgi:hypothetical protein
MNMTATINPYTTMTNRLTNRTISFLLLAGACLNLSATCLANSPADNVPTQEIRGYLENQFRGITGLGFKEFRCDYPDTWPASREFMCFATDEENDQFIYRIVFQPEQNAPLVSMIQPVSQLNPSGLSVLSQPCEAFLAAFANEDWNNAFASLSRELREQLGIDGLKKILVPLREKLGSVSEPQPRYYANPSQSLHQLEFLLNTEPGNAVGRFRLRIDSNNKPQIISFLITAEPGSPLQSLLLKDIGKTVLTQFFDQPIDKIDGPLESLEFIGDNAELQVVMQDGSSVMARIEQKGSTSDIDSNDYSFHVLDARTLIRLYLSSGEQPVQTIECPTDVAPDGGFIDCVVTFNDGSNTDYRLMRRGGEHRLAEAD